MHAIKIKINQKQGIEVRACQSQENKALTNKVKTDKACSKNKILNRQTMNLG